ncbi:hypothetical protein MPNT_260022 [Candidatus Methylacidithermus pantelleriae]|uniref:Glycosyltransferase 2-like domain-containing protein n=1 Tax=Candidatus Methylacidithermus pantelleriae TaxID=2744239 RepID=A0A8J2FQ96_9BACT|nr:hypothetical protein MPNT_260022 [Candidatus Methylacidithermus pantelleriae]
MHVAMKLGEAQSSRSRGSTANLSRREKNVDRAKGKRPSAAGVAKRWFLGSVATFFDVHLGRGSNTKLVASSMTRESYPLAESELIAILPAYNEAVHLGAVLEELGRFVSQRIVIDDGSTDETSSIARLHGACVFRHPVRRGKTEAIRTGLLVAPPSRWVLFLDADGQHDPGDFPALWEKREGVDAVLGMRDLSSPRMPWLRRWANQAMSRILRAIVGGELVDTQCGFRLVKRSVFSQWMPAGWEYQWESELYGWLLLSQTPVRMVPVRTCYAGGVSHIFWPRELWGFLCCCCRLLRIRWVITRTVVAKERSFPRQNSFVFFGLRWDGHRRTRPLDRVRRFLHDESGRSFERFPLDNEKRGTKSNTGNGFLVGQSPHWEGAGCQK